MGVDVDETGSDDLARRVDLFAPGADVRSHRDDAVALDRHIGHERLAARAVDDGAAANHQIVHLSLPSFGFIAQPIIKIARRSEEHTSELQSLMRTSYAVFCLKKTTQTHIT